MTDSHPDSAPPPSAKAKGKRPASSTPSAGPAAAKREDNTPGPSAAASNTPKSGMQTRPKRVLPTRSRRGGPGVGSCDVDVMILETRKRRLESEPLIPGSTRFLLTTNACLVPPANDGTSFEIQLNTQAYSRYFDRPEVQKAYKEQQIIQTPEFSLLPEDAVVGGRFRPRGSDEELADTSDAAYEKRHRKYETFEKRQRLREKEKLKHEQYKLKERIEQLRGMDTAAFLSLPASSFSEPPGVVHEGAYGAGETGIADLPGAHVNGAAAYNEAERRRQEMLEVAESLEERYRVLLPPDRKWAEKKEAERREKEKERLRRGSAGEQSVSAEPQPSRRGGAHAHAHAHNQTHSRAHEPEPEEDEEEENEDEEAVEDEDADEVAPAPELPRKPVHKRDSDGESEVDLEQRDRERSKGLKIRLKLPPGLIIPKREPGARTGTPTTTTKRRMGTHQTHLSWTPDSHAHSLSASPSHRPHRGRGKPRGGDGRFLPKQKRYRADSEGSSTAAVPPVKRHKAASSLSASASASAAAGAGAHGHGKAHASPTARTECLLLKAAERNAAVPSARKTQRHMLAFGVAVPEELSQVRDFEIPLWCWPSEGQTDEEEEEEEEEEEDGDENELGDDADVDAYWHAHGLNGDGPGSATPAFEPHEHWADGLQDSKAEFPEVATLGDD